MIKNNLKHYVVNLILFFFMTSIIFSQNDITKNDFFLLGKNDLKETLNSGLLPEAYLKFKQMQNDAKKEGVEIEIVSGYRSYQKQKDIWNNKYNKNFENGILGIKNINRIIIGVMQPKKSGFIDFSFGAVLGIFRGYLVFVLIIFFINNNVSTRIFPDFMKSGSFKGLVNYGENLLDDIPQELNQLNNIGN